MTRRQLASLVLQWASSGDGGSYKQLLWEAGTSRSGVRWTEKRGRGAVLLAAGDGGGGMGVVAGGKEGSQNLLISGEC